MIVTLLAWDLFIDVVWWIIKTYWKRIVFVIIIPLVVKAIIKKVFLEYIVHNEGILHRGWYTLLLEMP